MNSIKNWQLSIMIVIVSVLSIGLIQQYALAQWVNPGQQPGVTGPATIVVNPMTGNLNLNNNDLSNGGTIGADTINANTALSAPSICLNEDCQTSWPTGLWNAGTGGIYYSDGNVGIGLDSPLNPLHISRLSGDNAEVKIQSTGDGWGIYHNRDDEQLRFWNGSNRVIFSSDGKVAINKAIPEYSLDVYNNVDNTRTISGQNRGNAYGMAVFGQYLSPSGAVDARGILGVRDASYLSGSSIGVIGTAKYGVYARSNASAGAGVYSEQGDGSDAAYFKGNVRLADSAPGQKSYLTIHHSFGAPNSADCSMDNTTKGRMVFDYQYNRLFICNEQWRYVDLSTIAK